jgi:transcriptional regulator with XRE-family HTH domain
VDNRTEVREFLATRRAKITPDQAGVPLYGQRRRVPGLRREEVAQLAGVSTDYYTRLEKGNLASASDGVLDAIARALQLDEAERAHLHDLARAANTSTARAPRRAQPQLRPSLQRILDSMTLTPAFVRNGRLDLLAVNPLCRAVYAAAFDDPVRPANLARFCFLHPAAQAFHADWDDAASTTVALLRTEAGRDPYDRALSDLVGELATRSEEFRTRWAAHNVRLHRTGDKHFVHPVVGPLDLTYDAMEIPAAPGLTLTAYTAEPGSASEERLRLLASWAATSEEEVLASARPEPEADAPGRPAP